MTALDIATTPPAEGRSLWRSMGSLLFTPVVFGLLLALMNELWLHSLSSLDIVFQATFVGLISGAMFDGVVPAVERRLLTIFGSPDAVRSRVVAAIRALRLSLQPRTTGDHVEAVTTVSWTSLGEWVTAGVRPAADGRCDVLIESRPWGVQRLMDFGRSRRNVEKVLRALEAEGTRSPSAR